MFSSYLPVLDYGEPSTDSLAEKEVVCAVVVNSVTARRQNASAKRKRGGLCRSALKRQSAPVLTGSSSSASLLLQAAPDAKQPVEAFGSPISAAGASRDAEACETVWRETQKYARMFTTQKAECAESIFVSTLSTASYRPPRRIACI